MRADLVLVAASLASNTPEHRPCSSTCPSRGGKFRGLLVAAAVTRTGVLRYADASGRQWAAYRPPKEVFAPESLATLRACPVTDLHPPELVTPETWEAFAKGHVDSPLERDGDFVVADLVLHHGWVRRTDRAHHMMIRVVDGERIRLRVLRDVREET